MSFTEIQAFETIEGMGKAGRVLKQGYVGQRFLIPKISFLPYAPLQPGLIDGAWEKYSHDIYRIKIL